MELSYESFLESINSSKTLEMRFSVKNYAHYRNCSIRKFIDEVQINGKKIELTVIKIKLTADGVEDVAFFNDFDKNSEKYKLFSMGKRGSFTLKQMWDQLEIEELTSEN